MRELRVEDALLYLDQVKVEFGDRPHIYNEFLNIMKTFKTQQIDTPGVIRRVSNLFQGNRRLVLGFNTFLPEGYKIELPEGEGPPVAVYRPPGSNVTHVLRESAESQAFHLGGGGSLSQMGGVPIQPPQQGPGGGPPPPRTQAAGAAASASAARFDVAHQQSQPSGHPTIHPPLRSVQSGIMAPHEPDRAEAVALAASAVGFGPKSLHLQHGSTGPPVPPAQQGGLGHDSAIPSRALHAMDIQSRTPPPPPAVPPSQSQHGGGEVSHRQQTAASGGRPPPVDTKLPARVGPPINGAPSNRTVMQEQPQQAPLEFDHAINYVTTIKKRFAAEPQTYKKFLEILHTYQKEQRGIKEVLDEVSVLFADHPDLLKEFTYFLPDAVQAQAKVQLDQVAKESEARKRSMAKQSIMKTAHGMQREAQTMSRPMQAVRSSEFERSSAVQVPFGATQGRTQERENAIIRSSHCGVVSFNPVLPPKKDSPTAWQDSISKGRATTIPELPILPNTAETAFFQRVKEHLNRKELQADKPTGSRRHTPYTEFLKCLHLFGAGVLNKEELVLLLKSLLAHGHAPKSGANAAGAGGSHPIQQTAGELLRDLDDILLGRGPFAKQEAALKDKSKYGGLRMHDFDFTNCENPTPSYVAYPSDFPHTLFKSQTGQTDLDSSVLNEEFLCIGRGKGKRESSSTLSLEAYDGMKNRHNVYEEAMNRAEDERFEMDMAIERNVQALRQIEPYAEEALTLRENEEKDGQPIGRLQYRLNRYAINSVHINAIARIYGDKGDEVLQHFVRNPLIVLPIVYQRLKQKDAEWRKLKLELLPRWEREYRDNYLGSLDVQCYFKRRELERLVTTARLLEECQRGSVSKAIKKGTEHVVPVDSATVSPSILQPTFHARHADPCALLFQPFVAVLCPVGPSHKEAIRLVCQYVRAATGGTSKSTSLSSVSALDKDRVARIVSEFMAPWFRYPAYWIFDEIRELASGSINPGIVKFVPGQRVVTIYGIGTITSVKESTYNVKLPIGTAFLGPSAILHALVSKDSPFVRRDGVMVREKQLAAVLLSSPKLDERYQILFCTERMYLFLRLYTFLCSVLSETRSQCTGVALPTSDQPTRRSGSDSPLFNGAEDDIQSTQVSQVIGSLRKVITKKMDVKEFESIGRRLCKDHVHQLAALPRLIERCGEALIRLAREDTMLQAFDYCRYQHNDIATVRSKCLALAPNAMYRVQFDYSAGSFYFGYLPKGTELLTAPRIVADELTDGHDNAEHGTRGDRMDVDDPIEEFEDGNHNGSVPPPALKRLKLK